MQGCRPAVVDNSLAGADRSVLSVVGDLWNINIIMMGKP